MLRTISLLCTVLGVCALCLADAPAKQTTAPAEAAEEAKTSSEDSADQTQAGKVTVVSVTGLAQKCDTTKKPVKWETVAAGDVLTELTIIRTGLNSSVMLSFADRNDVRIGSATKVGISEFSKDGPKVTTRLGLKYGTIRAHVHSERGPADFRVTTPTATLSVRGSKPWISFTADQGARGHSFQGKLLLVSAMGQQIVNKGEGISDKHNLPVLGLLAGFRTQLGDKFGGLSMGEVKNQMTNGGGRGAMNGFVPVNMSSSGPSKLIPLVLKRVEGRVNPGWP